MDSQDVNIIYSHQKSFIFFEGNSRFEQETVFQTSLINELRKGFKFSKFSKKNKKSEMSTNSLQHYQLEDYVSSILPINGIPAILIVVQGNKLYKFF